MRKRTVAISKNRLFIGVIWVVCVSVITCCALGQNVSGSNSTAAANATTGFELARHEKEFSSARIEPARMGRDAGVAVIFEGSEDLHYYAKVETATAPGFELKVQAKSDDFEFAQAIFPKWSTFTDSLGNKVEVYVGKFIVFVPIQTIIDPTKATGDVDVIISGQACTSTVCLLPFEKTLRTRIDWSQRDSWKQISFEPTIDAEKVVEVVKGPVYSTWFALALAFVAGLALNIMPCVWPVLPIIIMRIVNQAKAGRRQSTAMGIAFCLGILLFFASLAGVNIILKIFYGTVLQWGDQFRNPAFVTAMVLLLVVLALLMFGVFNISVPSSIASKSGSGQGYTGAVGTGFLAAILSTPCGFGILAVAFGWAQTQHWSLATVVIMFIGLGMAAPYAILTSIPGLLKRLPKAGKWMELFKQGVGFILLIIAVKLIGALPQIHRTNVLYFAVVLGFGVWMWGGWVSYNTQAAHKWLIRIIAIVLVFAAGWVFLPTPAGERIPWKDYNETIIDNALTEKRPVLIKFTADWCLSCQTVNKVVYHREDIVDLIDEKGVLVIKGDTTAKDHPATRDLKNKYNEPGVPVTVLFIPGAEEPVKFHGIFFAGKLKNLLQKLPSK